MAFAVKLREWLHLRQHKVTGISWINNVVDCCVWILNSVSIVTIELIVGYNVMQVRFFFPFFKIPCRNNWLHPILSHSSSHIVFQCQGLRDRVHNSAFGYQGDWILQTNQSKPNSNIYMRVCFVFCFVLMKDDFKADILICLCFLSLLAWLAPFSVLSGRLMPEFSTYTYKYIWVFVILSFVFAHWLALDRLVFGLSDLTRAAEQLDPVRKLAALKYYGLRSHEFRVIVATVTRRCCHCLLLLILHCWKHLDHNVVKRGGTINMSRHSFTVAVK